MFAQRCYRHSSSYLIQNHCGAGQIMLMDAGRGKMAGCAMNPVRRTNSSGDFQRPFAVAACGILIQQIIIDAVKTSQRGARPLAMLDLLSNGKAVVHGLECCAPFSLWPKHTPQAKSGEGFARSVGDSTRNAKRLFTISLCSRERSGWRQGIRLICQCRDTQCGQAGTHPGPLIASAIERNRPLAILVALDEVGPK